MTTLNPLSTVEYRIAVAEPEGQARALGADTLITPYHKRQME